MSFLIWEILFLLKLSSNCLFFVTPSYYQLLQHALCQHLPQALSHGLCFDLFSPILYVLGISGS